MVVMLLFPSHLRRPDVRNRETCYFFFFPVGWRKMPFARIVSVSHEVEVHALREYHHRALLISS